MYNKITNPETGRQVSIYGKRGQMVLRKYLTIIQQTVGGFRKMKGGALDCSKCGQHHTGRTSITGRATRFAVEKMQGRTKEDEIQHLITKFKDCKPECPKLKELKTKFETWNRKYGKGDKIKRIELIELKVIGLKNLKSAGFESTYMFDEGFTAKDLKEAGFSLEELKEAGFSLEELKEAGFSLEELKEAGFSLKELKEAFSLKELKSSWLFSAKDLKNAGFSAKEMKSSRLFSAKDLKQADFPVEELKNAGYPAWGLKEEFSLKELKETFSAKELKDADFSLEELKEAGFSAKDLKKETFSLRELKEADFSLEELKEAFSLKELKKRFGVMDLQKAGFSIKDLKEAGFSAKNFEIEARAYNDVRQFFSANRSTDPPAFSLKELKEGTKFSCVNFKYAGYTAKDLKEAGFSAQDLKDRMGYGGRYRGSSDQYSPSELKEGGFSAKELIQAGFSAQDLKQRGVLSAEDMKNEDFSKEECKEAGFTLSECWNAGAR